MSRRGSVTPTTPDSGEPTPESSQPGSGRQCWQELPQPPRVVVTAVEGSAEELRHLTRLTKEREGHWPLQARD